MTPVRAFSAPGKALLAGGYLVLDPTYNAYVTALSSRMHAVIRPVASNDTSEVSIESPQFERGKWVYRIDTEHKVDQVEGDANPFILATLQTIIQYVQPKQRFNYHITIFSDAGYHTQQDTKLQHSANGAASFLYHQQPIGEVAKTGLGSSAGLVSVITTALVCALLDASSIDQVRDKIHNLAQISHCLAQKKIGSGFDVATAIYGSIIYRRFAPEVINDYFHDGSKLGAIVDAEWDFNHTNCNLPPGIKLLMGDIRGGSETPKLVSKVLQWARENPDASKDLYAELNAANMSLIHAFDGLHNTHATNNTAYQHGLQQLAQAAVDTQVPDIFVPLVEAVANIRRNLQKLTQCTGADIEPQPQTKLLDACSSVPGCLGGVVPGAGGYDAISLLMVESSVAHYLELTANDPRFANVSWLQLHEEADGVLEEKAHNYEGLPGNHPRK